MRVDYILASSQFFSSWGDRMWTFATGLYLIKLTPNSLRLAALFGLVLAVAIVSLAPALGFWVDRTKRLTVVRTTIGMMNLFIFLSAVLILLLLFDIPKTRALLLLCQVLVIICGALANLFAEGTKIAIGRDWVIVVAGNDKVALADLNSLLRRINLVCAILAPVAVGFLMTVVSSVSGIIFICCWNFVTMFIEYGLLVKVYDSVPELALKIIRSEYTTLEDANDSTEEKTKPVLNPWKRLKGFLSSWLVYYKQKVLLAGLSLSMLYLTVLGFNSITTGYAYTQRLNEVTISVLFGAGSLVGIIGTFFFPLLRSRFGLMTTGLIGFSLQLFFLMLCFISIWMPGSPSLMYKDRYVPVTAAFPSIQSTNTSSQNTAITPMNITSTTVPQTPSTIHTNPPIFDHFSYASIVLMMVSVVMSRAGLWITDLTVTQLQQENVIEEERGKVGGAQSAMNSLLDLSHFVLAILLPLPQDFGILIVISLASILTGYLFYVIFYFKHRDDKEFRSKESVLEAKIVDSDRNMNEKEDDKETFGTFTTA